MNFSSRTAQTLATGAVAVGASAASAGAAQAALVTVSETISVGALASAGGESISGMFNINSLMASGANAPYDIVSASIAAYGYSDIQYAAAANANYSGYQANGGYTYTYSQPYTYYYPYTYYVMGYYSYQTASTGCGWWGRYACYASGTYYYPQTYYSSATGYYNATGNVDNYLQGHDVLHTDAVADQLTVTAAGSSATGTASLNSSSASSYGAQSLTSSNSGTGYVNYYYDQQRDVYTAIYGETDATTALGAAALADLAATGNLDYVLSSPTGQVTVNTVVLGVTYDDSPIPEPATTAALAVGVGTLLAATRRRAKANKTIH